MKFIDMIKKIIFIITLGFSVILYGQSLEKPSKVDGVEVVIGSNIVLQSDVIKFKEELNQNPLYKDQKELSSCEILENLMLNKLLAHQAVIDSVEVSQEQILSAVKRQVAYFKQQLGSEEKVVEFYGFDDMRTLKDALSKIEKEKQLIAKEKQKIMEKIGVSPEEVRVYYKGLKDKNELPEFGDEVSFAQITIGIKPTQKAVQKTIDKLNEIREDLINGSNFKMKALVYSKDPAVIENGGAYTINKQSAFVREFKEVAFGLDEGEISKPFKTLFGYHIVKLEKIVGKNLEVRHILMSPEILEEDIKKVEKKITAIKDSIVKGDLDFEKAVLKYSEDEVTKQNKGLVINAADNTASFELTRMDPRLYAKINVLEEGEMTAPFIDETREEGKMFKFFKLVEKRANHIADFTKDYMKIQALALSRKREETLSKWYKKTIKKTYIKIGNHYKKCAFKYDWLGEKNF